jgi:sodium/hydrogen antiporter
MTLLAIFVALVFLHSLVSARLERTIVTAPIVFTMAGMLAFFVAPEMRGHHGPPEWFLKVSELGLVLLLFSEASHIDLGVLKKSPMLSVRLLSTGMLLTILLGGVGALLVFPTMTLGEAGILAAILAATDAGLGQTIVNSPRVPIKIRKALEVEAGLNDGLAVPFLLFFMALAGGGTEGGRVRLAPFIGEQLGYGVLVGVGLGLAGGWLLGAAERREWVARSWLQPGMVALPLLCLLVSDAVGASMFIAAFVAGMAMQIGSRGFSKHSVMFAEHGGQLVNLFVFFLFGVMTARAWPQFRWTHALYAILSLTVVRMVPVAVAVAGTGLSRATVLFLGWFGPRGLASIVLGLVYLEQQERTSTEPAIRLAVMATVLGSIFAHGLSALPGTEMYARKVKALPPDAPEVDGVEADAAGRAPASDAQATRGTCHEYRVCASRACG